MESTDARTLHRALASSWGRGHERGESGEPPTIETIVSELEATQGHWTSPDEEGRVSITDSGRSYVTMLDNRYDSSGGHGDYR